MSTIYKLNFSNGDYYIGQTTQAVVNRIRQHKATKGKGCPLLAQAWESNEFTGYEILEDNVLDLDDREIYWIKELKPKLNTLKGGKSIQRGTNHPRAKYSQEQITQVVDLYLNSYSTLKEISTITDVGYGIVNDVIKQRNHQWAWENVSQEQIAKAEELRNPAYTFYDQDNNKLDITTNLNTAEKILHLTTGTLARVARGQKSSTHWSLKPHLVLQLTDPKLEKFILTQPRALQFLNSFDELSKYQIDKLVYQITNSADWQVQVLPPGFY